MRFLFTPFMLQFLFINPPGLQSHVLWPMGTQIPFLSAPNSIHCLFTISIENTQTLQWQNNLVLPRFKTHENWCHFQSRFIPSYPQCTAYMPLRKRTTVAFSHTKHFLKLPLWLIKNQMYYVVNIALALSMMTDKVPSVATFVSVKSCD